MRGRDTGLSYRGQGTVGTVDSLPVAAELAGSAQTLMVLADPGFINLKMELRTSFVLATHFQALLF